MTKRTIRTATFRRRAVQRLGHATGAIDLASIMVGVLVIGIIAGVLSAVVFAVIPWSQDKAAQENLGSVRTAESVYRGMDSDNGYKFGNMDDLVTAGKIPASTTISATTNAAGDCYIAAAKSATGQVFWNSDADPTPKKYEDGDSSDCADVMALIGDVGGVGGNGGGNGNGGGTPSTPATTVVATSADLSDVGFWQPTLINPSDAPFTTEFPWLAGGSPDKGSTNVTDVHAYIGGTEIPFTESGWNIYFSGTKNIYISGNDNFGIGDGTLTTLRNFYDNGKLTMTIDGVPGNTIYLHNLSTSAHVPDAATPSASGITWQRQITQLGGAALTFGNGVFVAGDWNGYVKTSTDGVTWTPRSVSSGGNWLDVSFNGGRFYARGGFGAQRMATSTDGINWTLLDVPGGVKNMVYGAGTWVTFEDGDGLSAISTWTSTDGINFTHNATPMPVIGRNYTAAYGNGKFIANIEDNTVVTSTDGVHWTVAASSIDVGNITYDATTSLFYGTANDLFTSPDGVTWSDDNSFSTGPIARGSGILAIANTLGQVWTSTNGHTWSQEDAPNVEKDPIYGQYMPWYQLVYGNGIFVGTTSNDGYVMTGSR